MKTLKSLLIFSLLCIVSNVQAQKTLIDKGTGIFVIPKNMTIEQAEVEAVRQVQNQIIEDNFGTVVGSASTITMSNRNGQSETTSFTFGDTEVRGEWLETTSGPDIERKLINGEFALQVTIAGKIREIVSAPIMYNAKVLRNGVEDNCESDTFKYGDYMYMSFQSPEDGYLSIYITDGKDVQCLFPYEGLQSDYMHLKADKRYVFFSRAHSGEIDPGRVAICKLGCQEDNEHNRIYLIFSPNKYSKAVDYSASMDNMPRHLSFEEFHNWLSKLRRLDKELTCKPFDIVISK
ncbi:MAG: hypothetical protein IJ450_00225 [Bacteroidales bacterium]|nr:hypothetical protein [Bacteroidales bacterium]